MTFSFFILIIIEILLINYTDILLNGIYYIKLIIYLVGYYFIFCFYFLAEEFDELAIWLSVKYRVHHQDQILHHEHDQFLVILLVQ